MRTSVFIKSGQLIVVYCLPVKGHFVTTKRYASTKCETASFTMLKLTALSDGFIRLTCCTVDANKAGSSCQYRAPSMPPSPASIIDRERALLIVSRSTVTLWENQYHVEPAGHLIDTSPGCLEIGIYQSQTPEWVFRLAKSPHLDSSIMGTQ